MRAVFTKEYGIVTRATNQEDYRSGYYSTETLRDHPAAKTSTATPKYNTMLEYAAALEDQVTDLQTETDDESSVAGQTIVSNFAASATTVHREKSTLIEELRADSKEQTAQIKRLNALVNFLASKSKGPTVDPTRDRCCSGNRNNRKLVLALIAIKLGSPTLTMTA